MNSSQRLSVQAWRHAIDAAARWRDVWVLGDHNVTDPLRRLGTLFHVMHLAPYCMKYKRKYHPKDSGLDAGTYWLERDERSKYPDDPAWRNAILQVLRTVPADTTVPQFRFEVPTYHGPASSAVYGRQFLRSADPWILDYEGTLYRVEFDHIMPEALFLTPSADDDTYQLADICSWIPGLRSYLEPRTAAISNEDGTGVLRRHDETYCEGPREDRGEHGAQDRA